MIDRVIYIVLQRGLEKLKTNTGPFERYLVSQGFPVASAIEWRTQFLAEGVRLIEEFPTAGTKFPIISIAGLEQREETPFIGDTVDNADEAWGFKPGDPEFKQPILGQIDKTTTRATVWAENPDVCRWTLMLARWLVRKDADNMIASMGPLHMSSQAITLDQEKFGDHLFCRQLTFEGSMLDMQVLEGVHTTLPIRVAGAFVVDPTGANEQGGISPAVTPVIAGSE